ncbi:MAG: hypothetical protein ACI9T9_001255, partial [Oleiphilaceae bacterium]
FEADPIPTSVNIYDPAIYSDDSHVDEWQREGRASYLVAARSWELLGSPLRARPYGTVDFMLLVLRADALPESMSCLNPGHFEQVLLRSEYYGGPASPASAKCKSPVNWQTQEKGKSAWVYYETHRDFSERSEPPLPFEPTFITSRLNIPLDDRHFLQLNFRYLGYAPVEPCLANMNELRDSVCNSVKLSRGVSAEKALAAANKRWPDVRAQQIRKPELWVYPEWRRGNSDNGEPSIIILKQGSPAPEFMP